MEPLIITWELPVDKRMVTYKQNRESQKSIEQVAREIYPLGACIWDDKALRVYYIWKRE